MLTGWENKNKVNLLYGTTGPKTVLATTEVLLAVVHKAQSLRPKEAFLSPSPTSHILQTFLVPLVIYGK